MKTVVHERLPNNPNGSELSVEFKHIGILVNDLDKTLGHMKGLPDFQWDGTVAEWERPKEKMIVGNGYKGRAAYVAFGGITIEIIQPLVDYSFHADAIKARGEGIHHICYNVKDDFDRIVREFDGDKYQIVAQWESDVGRTVFIQSKEDGTIYEFTGTLKA